MSFFRLPRLRRAHASRKTSGDGSARAAHREKEWRRSNLLSRPRSLRIDALESRELLSVGPLDWQDVVINQSLNVYDPYFPVKSSPPAPYFPSQFSVQDPGTGYVPSSQYTLSAKSLAADHDGDFVVVWTRNDPVINPNTGQVMIDPATGGPRSDLNIYARYLTDEVQRIILPPEILADNNPAPYTNGSFALDWGGNEVQKISLSTTWEPYTSRSGQSLIVGTFTLGFDLDGDGSIGANEKTTIIFNESDFLASNPAQRPQAVIQTQLRGLGGALADATVEALSPLEYNVNFGAASQGLNQPMITVEGQAYSSGFFPAVQVSSVRDPITISDILVSATSPWLTALAIEDAFKAATTTTLQTAPIEVQAPVDYSRANYPAPYYTTVNVRVPNPGVTVVPVLGLPGYQDGTVFDVTFAGQYGKQDVPQMKISAAADDTGTDLMSSPELAVRTMKEPSPEFRVNPAEPVNPLTGLPDPYDQRNPAVAMDADGDFVIVWESIVPNYVNPGSKIDIFARRFSPQATVDPALVDFVPSVRALGGEFRVNSSTTNIQNTPAVAMDFDGNFVIAWASIGQELSFFNGIYSQLYNRDGERVGNEMRVTPETTSAHLNPAVGMSRDGRFAVAWETTNDPNYFLGRAYTTFVTAQIFDARGIATSGQLPVGGGGGPSVTFDPANRMLLTWEVLQGQVTPGSAEDTHARMFELNGNIVRDTFKVNGGTASGLATPPWPYHQFGGQAGLDNDGDLIAAYSGYAPDMSEFVFIAGQEFQQFINAQENADLLPYFNPLQDYLVGGLYFFDPNFPNGSNGDIDAAMELVLVNALRDGATDSQIGRLSAILNRVATLLRGDANGVMYTRWDADPTLGTLTVLTADNVVNATRDGHNTRYYLALSASLTGGNFTVDIANGETGWIQRGIQISPVYTNNILNIGRTTDAIRTSIIDEGILGGQWAPYSPSSPGYEGPVEVRLMSTPFMTQEVDWRASTPWAVTGALGGWPADFEDSYAIWEITFQGSVHDSDMYMYLNDLSGLQGGTASLRKYEYGDPGISQVNSSMAVQPDGSFVIAWTQQEEFTDGLPSNSSIRYRRFEETTDTAGPLVTDFLLPDGRRLNDRAQITEELQQIVVVFDEDMMRVDPKKVSEITNPGNWVLMRDGVNVQGGIKTVQFGMNMAADLGLVAIGSNKWEAVITFDGNGASAGMPPLQDGHYQIVAKSSLRDVAGNPLGRGGLDTNGDGQPDTNGYPIPREFDIIIPANAGEIRVNPVVAGAQATFPNSPQAVANDADGEYVAVYTSDTPGQEGVYARLYTVVWTKVGNERVSSIVPGSEIRVTDNPTATYPSVAMDADGDFVVTWSQLDPDPYQGNAVVDWNVYARRYTHAGIDMSLPWQVNSEVQEAQRFSTVAMDAEGDFVITWQSYAQDESGYGIYAQRYSPAGDPMGGLSEVQALTFVNRPAGTFRLAFDHDNDPGTPDRLTDPIPFRGNTFAAVGDIEDALRDPATTNLDVRVQATTMNELLVRFVGKYGSRDVAQLKVVDQQFSDPNAKVLVSTRLDGTTGEFRVNDTTTGNQQYPSIAMDAEGTFVITWTSEGQDGDLAYETNVYAKSFIPNQALRGSQRVSQPGVVNTEAMYRPLIVTTDSPANHIVRPGTTYDGVVLLTLERTDGIGLGTGALLNTSSRTLILTAAHNVCDNAGNLVAYNVISTFDITGGSVAINSAQIYPHPLYTGVPWVGGHDLAIIVLDQPAPAGVPAYDIYRASDEISQAFTKVGYGRSGQGDTGDTLASGTKRSGRNTYDALDAILGNYGDSLAYDFDNGLAANDAFGVQFGLGNTGLGNDEICGAPGDSGGPNFIGGSIAGVTSYGQAVPGASYDVLPGLNSSFGDFGADVRVSQYASWIDSITAGGGSEFLVNDGTWNRLTPSTGGNQMWSSVAMDLDGDFVITWTSYGQDAVGSGYGSGQGGENGIFAKRYNNSAQPVPDPNRPDPNNPGQFLANEFQVNTFSDGNQQYSRIGMDASGDFVVTWESFQDRSGAGGDVPDSYGIYAQRYRARVLPGGTPNGMVGSELHISTTIVGDQRYPSAAMDHTGDFIIVWSGPGQVVNQADDQGLFYVRFEARRDDAGPIVADVLNYSPADADNRLRLVREGTVLDSEASQFVIDFGENLTVEGGVNGVNSVINPTNWQITKNGIPLVGGVVDVQFGKNMAFQLGIETNPSEKYQAVVTFDGDSNKAGLQTLGAGQYVLTIREAVRDLFGNPLDGNYDGVAGGNFNRTFSVLVAAAGPGGPGTPDPTDPDQVDVPVNLNTLGRQDSPAVARDAVGNYVVVWVSYGEQTDLFTEGNIVAQRFDRSGNKLGVPITINSYTTGHQASPDVAMDPFGNFVVVWSGAGRNGVGGSVDTRGVFYRRFDSAGTPLDESEIRVNSYVLNIQEQPAVAMDSQGNFAVVWQGEGRDAANVYDVRGVWARRYSSLGTALDPVQVLVNAPRETTQEAADVAMDASGNYFVVWRSERQDAGAWGVYGQRFNADGTRAGGELHLNQNAYAAKVDPRIAMDAAGGATVVWAGIRSDGFSEHVFARRFAMDGSALDGGQEFFIDSANSVGYLKQQAAVAMSNKGHIVVTWSSYGQDELEADPPSRSDGVFAHLFNEDGSEFLDPATGLPLGDFRINATVAGDQNDPDVAMDANGNFSVVWVGPDVDLLDPLSTGIWTRGVTITAELVTPMASYVGSDGWSGGWSDGSQYGNKSLTDSIVGTAGDDQIVLVAGMTPSSWSVTVNGQLQSINLRASALVIDGRGGRDTVSVLGTTGEDLIEVWADRFVVTDAAQTYSFTASNIEVATIDGKGGADRAVFHDSAGADLFTFHAGTRTATLSNVSSGSSVTTKDVPRVEIASTGGADTARLTDSSDRDVFTADPSGVTFAPFSGGAYAVQLTGFRTVEAVSASGGSDMAKLYTDGSSARDTLVADPSYVQLSNGNSYTFRTEGFKEAQVFGSGGLDKATFYASTSPVPDTFTADAKTGEALMLWGNRAYVKSYFFNDLEAASQPGNNDIARLYDSNQADTFVADAASGTLSGLGFSYKATGFRNLYAYATPTDGKNDVATLNDSAGVDTFIGTATYGMLTSSAFATRANAFDSVVAWSRSGVDFAKLYDSAKTDTFVAHSDVASLGANEVHNFPRVQAFSVLGGNDTAKFVGSGEKDWFVVGEGYAYIYNQSRNYYARANSFRNVEASLTAAHGDQANLTDSAFDDTFNAYVDWAEFLFGPNGMYGSAKVSGFASVSAAASLGVDVANLNGSTGSDSFVGTFNGTTATGTLTTRNADGSTSFARADKFEQIHANAVAGGTDTARLTDSALIDLLYLHEGLARLTDGNAGIGMWANGFGTVTSKLSSNEDRVEILPPVSFDYLIDQPQ